MTKIFPTERRATSHARARHAAAARCTLLGALLLAALLLAAPAPAGAYVFLCRSWQINTFSDGCPVGYQPTDDCGCTTPATAPKWYGAQLALRVESQGGNGITASQFVTAAGNAAKSWTDVSGSSMIVTAQTTFAAINTARWGSFNNDDDLHEVFYVTNSNEWYQVTGSGAGGTLGVTVSPWNSWDCSTRAFYDTDILINGFIQGGWTTTDVESTLLHEMGHSVGLGHPCLAGYLGCSNSCTAVMAASGGDFTTPQQDDFLGISALYPGTPGGLGAGCVTAADCTGGRPCITYQGFRYCSQTCTTTCPTGYQCRNVDGANVCARQGVPALGDACTAQCETGAVCLYAGNGGICRQECDPNNDQCPDGGRCVELQDGGGACFPPGDAQEGEVCESLTDCAAGLICLGDPDGGSATCWRECNPSTLTSCGSDAMCIDLDGSVGYCVPAVGAGAICTDALCFDGLVCVGDDTTYRCQFECNPAGADTCPPGERCLELSDGSGACFTAGTNQEGDECFSGVDCVDGLICVGTAQSAECFIGCNPQSPSCPHNGQTCVPLSGSSDGVCDPPGGIQCTCDTTPDRCDAPTCACDALCNPACACDVRAGCDQGCTCDPECEPVCPCDLNDACVVECFCDGDCPCACDATSRCELGCTCDPNCTYGCTCNTTPGCEAGCDCDPECQSGCLCDTTSGCDAGCACDSLCGAVCACDQTGLCDAGCSCDPDCGGGCGCDVTAGCDAGCACDTVCQAGCTCNVSLLCDGGCTCDPECGGTCACDGTAECDKGCACDPLCCACDSNYQCQAGCDCDPECAAVECTCDAGPECDEGCGCDTDCGGEVCACDVDSTCDRSCSCDAGCRTCPCNSSLACDEGCRCDDDCDGGGACSCDATAGACDPDPTAETYTDCSCDGDCPCTCDATFECDADCACDVDCVGGASCAASTPESFAGLLIALASLGRGRRRRRP